MKTPDTAQTFETPVTKGWMGDDGILYSISTDGARNLANYKKVIEVYKQLAEKHGKLLILANTSKSVPIEREARVYLAEEFPKYIKAMAVISTSALGRMIANIFVTMKPNQYEFKMFSDEEEAKSWLRGL